MSPRFRPHASISSITRLKDALQLIASWMTTNLLTLTSSNTEYLLIGLKSLLCLGLATIIFVNFVVYTLLSKTASTIATFIVHKTRLRLLQLQLFNISNNPPPADPKLTLLQTFSISILLQPIMSAKCTKCIFITYHYLCMDRP